MTSGTVVAISQDWRGDTLAADAAAAATELQVAEAVDFDEDGGWLVVGESDPLEYLSVTDPEDGTPATLTLADPLEEDLEAGLPVVLWDPSVPGGGSRVVEYLASVQLSEDAGVTDAVIPHEQIPVAGIENLIGASVSIEEDDEGEWWVAYVHGREPVVDGGKIDPTTLPPPADPELPVTSPTPVVTNGPNALIVSFDYVQGITYDLHLSVTDPGAAVPDVTTLHTEGFLSGQWVRNDADGIALTLGEQVWVAIVARTATAGSAAASPWVEGTPSVIPEANVETLFGSVIAERLSGETVTAVNLTGVVLDILGSLHAEPGFLDVLADVFRAKQAVLDDNLDIRGQNNVLRGRLVAGAGVSDPSGGPTVFGSNESLATAVDDPFVPPDNWYGLTPNPVAATQAVSVFSFVGGGGLRSHVLSDGTREPLYFADFADFYPTGGVTTIGGHLYVLGIDGTVAVDAWRVRKYDGTTLALLDEWDPGLNPSARPAIGTDGTDVLLAFARANGSEFRIRTFSTAGVQAIGSPLDVPHSLSSVPDLGGVGEGAYNLGATRIVIAPETADPHVYTTAGVRDTSREFPRANGNRLRGLHWDGTRFRHLDRAGNFWRYSLHDGAAADYTYTLVDGDAGGAGTAESLPSQATVKTIARGAWINISTPPPPDFGDVDDPDRVNVYIDDKRPTGGQYAAGTLLGTFDQVPAAGTAAPTVSGFAGRTATSTGSFESDSGLSFLRGDDEAMLPMLVQSGTVTIAVAASDTGTGTITFPEEFLSAPAVVLTTNQRRWIANLTADPSTTGVGIRVQHSDNTSTTVNVKVHWIAVVLTP